MTNPSSYVMPITISSQVIDANNAMSIKISANSVTEKVYLYWKHSYHQHTWGSYTNGGSATKLSDGYWYKSFSCPSGAGSYKFYSIASANSLPMESPPASEDATYTNWSEWNPTFYQGHNAQSQYFEKPIRAEDLGDKINKKGYEEYNDRVCQFILKRDGENDIYVSHPIDFTPIYKPTFNDFNISGGDGTFIYVDKPLSSFSMSGALVRYGYSSQFYSGAHNLFTWIRFTSGNAHDFALNKPISVMYPWNDDTQTWGNAYIKSNDAVNFSMTIGKSYIAYVTGNFWWDGDL